MTNPFVLFLLGFVLGILTGFFGVGGAFLLTPALNILGLQMVHSIGTSFFTLVGKTLFGVVRHRKLGNVDLRLGIILGLCSSAGVEFGKRLVFHLEKLNLVGTYVRVAYIILLASISLLMLREYYLHRKGKESKDRDETIGSKESTYTVAHHVYRIGLPPKISLPSSGEDAISIWVIVICGIVIGFLSGFMGLGGGFIGLPLLIYVIGVPPVIAVGTSLVIVFLTSCYGTAVYAFTGNVEWVSGLIILAGSIAGVQLGVYATEYVTGMKIKVLFALLLFFVAISVFLKQINVVTIGAYLVLGSACALSLAILFPLKKRFFPRY